LIADLIGIFLAGQPAGRPPQHPASWPLRRL